MKHLQLSIIWGLVYEIKKYTDDEIFTFQDMQPNLHLSRNVTHFLADSILADFLQLFCSFVTEIMKFKDDIESQVAGILSCSLHVALSFNECKAQLFIKSYQIVKTFLQLFRSLLLAAYQQHIWARS